MQPTIADRKLWQWTLGYVAGAWVVLEATGEISDLLLWPRVVQLVVLILLLFGLPTAVVLAWYHGEKGAQRVTPTEMLLISAITVTGVSTAFAVARATPRALDSLEPVAARLGDPELSATRYAVFPFRGEAGEDVPALGLLLRDALARWQGIELVDPALLEDALDPEAPTVAYLQDARERSRRHGAGRLMVGEVGSVGAGLRVRMEMRDTRSGQVLADTTLRLETASDADARLARVAEAILFRAEGLAAPDAGGAGTSSFPARVAFLEGMERLGEWRMEEAVRRFEEAGHLDPGYARAHLWHAQALHWSAPTGPSVAALAERALAGGSGLSDRESLLAQGIVRMGEGEWDTACRSYALLRDEDPRDFAAWLGLGHCRYVDPRVVRDPSSPTGWSFVSSHHAASEAYRRALALVPSHFRRLSGSFFEQARDLLYTRPTQVRVGRAAAPTGDLFAAYPTLSGDTLAFIPTPLEAFNRGETPGVTPGSHWSAVERQRRVLRDLSAGWLAAFRDDPEVLRAYALTLDLLGDPATLDTLSRARVLADTPALERRLALELVPRMVKYGAPDQLGALRRARALADSVLADSTGAAPTPALAAIAGLVGRVHLAAEVERTLAEPIRFPVEIPALVQAPAAALLAYAAFGGPADSMAVYEDRVVDAVENRIPPGERERALHELLDRPAVLAVLTSPLRRTVGLSESTSGPTLQAVGLLLRGRIDDARAVARDLEVDQTESRAADRTPDVLLPSAWLAVQLGDTAAAVEALDATLGSMRWLEPRALERVVMVAPLVRAMALRAELAHARGDPETAARWARAVAVLWDDADPPLQPLVSRMWTLARTPGTDPGGLASSFEP